MKNYQKRVIEEKRLLDSNIIKLDIFIENEWDSYDEESLHGHLVTRSALDRLCEQLEVMIKYSNILNQRIIRFDTEL